MLKVQISGYLDKLVTLSGDKPVAVMPIDIYDAVEQRRRTLFAPAGEYKDDQYVNFSDVDIIKAIEAELDRAGYSVVVKPAVPKFTTLTVEQSTIATKSFYVKEKDSQ